MVQATYEFILLRRQRLRSLAPSFLAGISPAAYHRTCRQVLLFPGSQPQPLLSDPLIVDDLAASYGK